MKNKKMNYRCSCCDNPVYSEAGYMRAWDKSGDTNVKICVSCNTELKNSKFSYVLDLICDNNEKALEELKG